MLHFLLVDELLMVFLDGIELVPVDFYLLDTENVIQNSLTSFQCCKRIDHYLTGIILDFVCIFFTLMTIPPSKLKVLNQ